MQTIICFQKNVMKNYSIINNTKYIGNIFLEDIAKISKTFRLIMGTFIPVIKAYYLLAKRIYSHFDIKK